MKLKTAFRFLPAAVLGMGLFASCNTTTFEVPKIGSRFDDTKKYLTYDTSLNEYVIPLSKYETLQYEKFDILVPQDDVVQSYAPALSNSSNNAELRVRNLPPETGFLGRAILAPDQEGWKSLSEMQRYFEEKFSAGKGIISRKVRITRFEGCNCIEYDVVLNSAEVGKVDAVHGFCMFDPTNPGYIFEVFAGRTAYKKDIDNEFLIRASGIFLDSVKFRP